MNNFGAMMRYEIRKILCRRITIVVLSVVTLIMIAMNVGEYIAGGKVINAEEKALSGRVVDDDMLSKMRDAIELKRATLSDGETIIVGLSPKDAAYDPLMNYLYMIGGNYDKAYNMTQSKLYTTFEGVIDDAFIEQRLTDKEIQYWNGRRADNPKLLTYGRIQNGWGDSVTIMYAVSLFILIAIAATLSGVFSDETSLKTDALIFSAVNGKKRLVIVKILAGVTVGLIESIIIIFACIGTEFAISDFDGSETSVQFFVGPTVMDMGIGKALGWYIFIMLIIGILFSVMAMCLSEVCHNSIAVIAIMMLLWLLSVINVPYSLNILSRIWRFLPVTFLGNWTFTDYRLINFFGKYLTIIESAPIIYFGLIVVMIIITKISYNRYQVKGR